MSEYQKILDEIEEKLGIKAYNELMAVFSKLYNQLQRAEKSRDRYKKKYMELKLK